MNLEHDINSFLLKEIKAIILCSQIDANSEIKGFIDKVSQLINAYTKLKAENEDLRHDIARHINIISEKELKMNDKSTAWAHVSEGELIHQLETENKSLRAKLASCDPKNKGRANPEKTCASYCEATAFKIEIKSLKLATELHIKIISELECQRDKVASKYTELIYAVARKFPEQSRHETALMYINSAEKCCNQTVSNKEQEK